MRYAVLSDIHSNLQAWNAVLLDIRSMGVDRIICLGDIVGYGPSPVQVLESVYTNVDHFVLGNHDAVLCGKLDEALFNDSARSILVWTRTQLTAKAVEFLATLPLALDGRTFRCAHGDFSEPGYFNYVAEPCDAMPSWHTVAEQLLFVGHTHVPSIFLLGKSGTPHVVEAQDFALEKGKRYLVNVGSVGQPRDGDARASYCIYDQKAGTVRWRRIPFDIDAYRAAVLATGIPIDASPFLDFDPRKKVQPLREMLNFRPPRSPEKAVQNVAAVQPLEVLQTRVRKWAVLFWISAAALAAVLVIFAWAWFSHRDAAQPVVITVVSPPATTNILVMADGANMLSVPSTAIPAGRPIPGWTIALSNRRSQYVTVEPAEKEGTPSVAMKSDGNQVRLYSHAFKVKPDTKYHVEAQFKRWPGFNGNISMGIEFSTQDQGRASTNSLFFKVPPSGRKNGWAIATGTAVPPPGSTSMRFEINGRFKGRTVIKNIQLRPQASSEKDATAPR